MKLLKSILVLFGCLTTSLEAQNNDLPYYEVPDAAGSYTAGTMASRMIDALGFRYYWATEELREEDLEYRPNSKARSIKETVDHIYNLTLVILNSVLKISNEGAPVPDMSFEEKRTATLKKLKEASAILRVSRDVSKFKILFKNKNGASELPFWNQINGPISDAIWHAGQIASFRRSSGNPLNSKVNFMTGKVIE